MRKRCFGAIEIMLCICITFLVTSCATVANPPPSDSKTTAIEPKLKEVVKQLEMTALVPAKQETKDEITEKTTSIDDKRRNKEKENTISSHGREVPDLIDVTPLTVYKDADNNDGAKGGYFSNSYTRISITSKVMDIDNNGRTTDLNNDRNPYLPYEERWPITRFFVGKKFDLNLSVKIKVGDYEATVPLITISHQSGRSGEQWARSIKHKLLNFPLFLVREDGAASIPEFRISLIATKEYTSSMVGAALQVAVAGIQQVAPESTVLTKLTEQTTKDKARAIDDAIGKLFGSGISEEHVTHRDMRTWCSNGGAAVTLWIPIDEKDWNVNLRKVGMWTISFEEPRPSIFSDWKICAEKKEDILCEKTPDEALAKVYTNVKKNGAGQILNYALVKNGNGLGTIRAYLLQQDWYAAAQGSFTGDDTADQKTADNLCRNIINAISGLGLNGNDANIVVWAAIHGLPQPTKIDANAYAAASTCKQAMYLIDNSSLSTSQNKSVNRQESSAMPKPEKKGEPILENKAGK